MAPRDIIEPLAPATIVWWRRAFAHPQQEHLDHLRSHGLAFLPTYHALTQSRTLAEAAARAMMRDHSRPSSRWCDLANEPHPECPICEALGDDVPPPRYEVCPPPKGRLSSKYSYSW